MLDSNYYTLRGYKLRSDTIITEGMEDYLEMIYRKSIDNKDVKINELASLLNVKPSSVSKMVNRLRELDLVNFEKYKSVSLTNKGLDIGAYLLYRHNVLKNFFKYINKEDYRLDQVEKIEHFIDCVSIKNIEKLLSKKNKV